MGVNFLREIFKGVVMILIEKVRVELLKGVAIFCKWEWLYLEKIKLFSKN